MVAISNAFITGVAAIAGLSPQAGGQCSLANYKPAFPANQTTLVAPAQAPKFLGLAFGVQNYTCSDASTYTAAGAVAELMDASCIASKPQFATIQNTAFTFWNLSQAPSIQTIIGQLQGLSGAPVLGQHYFVTNPVTGTGISPKWDFTSAKFKGNANAFFVGAVKANLPSPTDPTKNVAWLDVGKVQGALADEVFRYDTVGGQPPSSCTPGTALSVKYVSKYALYGGSI
ncbi:hypothetical protein C8Q80DRAFT_1124487 [Daedaleopsis nitida]|nr:hypothetical protein C8Q80DRAFT_1124487 [Daedaleopsis nitida]